MHFGHLNGSSDGSGGASDDEVALPLYTRRMSPSKALLQRFLSKFSCFCFLAYLTKL